MTSIEEREDLFAQLAKDLGQDPEALLETYKKQNHGRIRPELVAYGLQQLQVVTEDAPAFDGIYLGLQAQTVGGTSRQSLLIATPEGIRPVTVTPAPEIPLFAKVHVEKLTHSHNVVTHSEWYTAADASAISSPGMATPDEVAGMFTPSDRISGSMNQWWLFRAQVQYVNQRPAEKYDPKKPRAATFQPGQTKEQVKKRPMFDPADNSFAMSLQLVDGNSSLRVNVFDESVLLGLYPEKYLADSGGPEALLKWIRDPKVPDASKVESITNYLTRLEVIGLARGGDVPTRGGVVGAKLPTVTLSLRGGDGFLMVPEVYESLFANGHATPPTTPTAPKKVSAPAASTPAPAAAPAKVAVPAAAPDGDVARALLAHVMAQEGARLSTTEVTNLPTILKSDRRTVADALKRLLKDTKLKREGAFYVVVAAPEEDPLADLGSEDPATQ